MPTAPAMLPSAASATISAFSARLRVEKRCVMSDAITPRAAGGASGASSDAAHTVATSLMRHSERPAVRSSGVAGRTFRRGPRKLDAAAERASIAIATAKKIPDVSASKGAPQ